MLTTKQQQFVDRMAEIKYSVSNPEDYKNIESLMSLRCSNGHTISGTMFELLENDFECLECLRNFENTIEDKEAFLLSLDAATYTTGWAILNKQGQLLKTGLIEIDRKIPLWDRVHELTTEVRKLAKKHKIQVIAIEDIQFQHNVVVFKTLAMLRGILIYQLEYLDKYTVYGNCGADTWRSHAHIKGLDRENKKEATRIKAKLIYGRDFAEDEADAIFLARYAYDLHKECISEQKDESVQELITFGT